MVRCKYCNALCEEKDNFCSHCGKKQTKICNCWVKKEPYDCGQKSCPGYGLYKILSDAEKFNKKITTEV